LRETDSRAEAEGIRRAEKAITDADIVLWLEAPDTERADRPAITGQLLVVGTKIDIGPNTTADITLSTQTGEGLDSLVDRLRIIGEKLAGGEPALVSHERDRVALVEAIAAVEHAGRLLQNWELAAESLRQASASLERLIGRLDAEKVLDRLFASFCIGK
jgi:tRNA modification GTPase